MASSRLPASARVAQPVCSELRGRDGDGGSCDSAAYGSRTISRTRLIATATPTTSGKYCRSERALPVGWLHARVDARLAPFSPLATVLPQRGTDLPRGVRAPWDRGLRMIDRHADRCTAGYSVTSAFPGPFRALFWLSQAVLPGTPCRSGPSSGRFFAQPSCVASLVSRLCPMGG